MNQFEFAIAARQGGNTIVYASADSLEKAIEYFKEKLREKQEELQQELNTLRINQ